MECYLAHGVAMHIKTRDTATNAAYGKVGTVVLGDYFVHHEIFHPTPGPDADATMKRLVTSALYDQYVAYANRLWDDTPVVNNTAAATTMDPAVGVCKQLELIKSTADFAAAGRLLVLAEEDRFRSLMRAIKVAPASVGILYDMTRRAMKFVKTLIHLTSLDSGKPIQSLFTVSFAAENCLSTPDALRVILYAYLAYNISWNFVVMGDVGEFVACVGDIRSLLNSGLYLRDSDMLAMVASETSSEIPPDYSVRGFQVRGGGSGAAGGV